MKKVVNGKRYDTNTASLMGSDSYGYSRDINHWSEKLYRKSNGEYFLYGEGGPMTKYASSGGNNSWGDGEKIIPLSVDAAQKWAEEHLTGEQYEAIFGEIPEDDCRVIWSLNISAATVERVKRFAGERKMKLSEVVETALREYFEAQDK